MLTALARVDGRPLGVVANDPTHLGGAIDADGADKAARFLQLCDAFELPVLFLCDTPGFMVGPAAERTATVRHFARMFLARRQPERADGHDRAAQGLRPRRPGDGRRRLQGAAVHRRLADLRVRRHGPGGRRAPRHAPRARGDRGRRRSASASSRRLVAAAYERGRGLNMAAYGEIDDVIDPADSRRWIATLFDEHSGQWWRARRQEAPPRSTPGEARADSRGPATDLSDEEKRSGGAAPSGAYPPPLPCWSFERLARILGLALQFLRLCLELGLRVFDFLLRLLPLFDDVTGASSRRVRCSAALRSR